MITTNDESYKDTKLIIKGKKKIEPIFYELKSMIEEEFSCKIVNIYYDEFIVSSEKRPRLEVVFFSSEDSFRYRDSTYNYDKVKQKTIVEMFTVLLNKTNNQKYMNQFIIDNLLVVFSDFASVAQSEVNQKISKDEINKLLLDNNKVIWKIEKFFGSVHLFFYTDRQVYEYKDSILLNNIEEAYFDLINKYDDMGVYERSKFKINIDSKENFDTKYKGSWFSYWR